MKQSIEKFLEFNGKTLMFLAIDGTYWIAIRPVCEAINVEYARQFKKIKEDPILGPSLYLRTMMIPGDSQPRKYICIPEMFIYGWIFSIKSDSPELLAYKMECYKVLYEYFHGTITRRKKLFEEKARIQNERNYLENDLRKQDNFIKLEDLRAREARIGKELKEMDSNMLDEQLSMFKESQG